MDLEEFRGTETILVVEDQAEDRNYAAEVLQKYGYRVIQAASASEALRVCQQESAPIHLLLIDLAMPGTSGRELVTRLATMRPAMKTVFMSRSSDDAIAQEGGLDEGVHFIQRPFTPKDLARKIRTVFGTPAARILVVDDEAGVRSYLRTVLEQAGYVVSEAADGKEALRLALSEPLELVITDLVMPEREGIETIQALRRRVPGIRIIAISGAFGGRLLSAAKIMGADMVLDKPVSAEQVRAKVAEVLIERR